MTKWVTTLVGANIAVYLLQRLVPGLTEMLALVPALALQHPWTLVTYMFAHGSPAHIIFNLLSLYFFGPRLEALLGGKRFLSLYFLSGFGGAALSFLPEYYYVPIIGASGAILGVIAAYARVWPSDRILIYGILPIQARWYIVLFGLYSILGATSSGSIGGGTAHFAHLGGMIVGFFYMGILARYSAARRFQRSAQKVVDGESDREALGRWATIPVSQLHEINRGEVLRLLEKVRTQGARSLTVDERATLDRFSPT